MDLSTVISRKVKASPRKRILAGLAIALGLLGIVCYLVQAVYIAHHAQPYMDEGTYLYKGYLFATGVYKPFQDYGVWTNKMPLSFLIPGWIQLFFGPGLRTGRYFAITLGASGLTALWFLGKKLAGRWAGVLMIWAIAANQTLIKYYSMGISQVIVFFLLMWIIYLMTSEAKKIGLFILCGLLMGVMVTSRENLILVVPLFIAYVFWKKSWKAGVAFAGGFSIIFIAVHLIFWPNILNLWSVWLPWITRWISRGEIAGTTNALGLGAPFWFPQMNSASRWLSFWEATRHMLIPFAVVLSSLFVMIFQSREINKGKKSLAIVLTISFLLLWAAHAWASLANNYCVFCYSPYLGFFIPLGLIIGVLILPEWGKKNTSILSFFVVVTIVSLVIASIVFSLQDNLWLQIMRTELPKFHGLQLENGNIEFWRILSNRLYIDYSTLLINFKYLYTNIKILAGIILCGLAFAIAAITKLLLTKRKVNYPFSKVYLVVSLGCFSALTVVINWNEFNTINFGCGDVIGSNERTGEELTTLLRPNDLVYWDGGNSIIPLLYLNDIRIFPALLNGENSKRVGGDAEVLKKSGFWNEELAIQWRDEADVLLIAGDKYEGTSYNWSIPEVGVTSPVYACNPNSSIFVLRNR